LKSVDQLDRLREIKVIDDRQLWAAQAFRSLHEVAFTFLSYSVSRELIPQIMGSETRQDIPPPLDI
jgi:hypothetical protein